MKRFLRSHGHLIVWLIPAFAWSMEPTAERAVKMLGTGLTGALWYLIAAGTIRFVLLMRYYWLLRHYRRHNPAAYYIHAMQQTFGGK